MRTPSGTECRFYYEDFNRGRKVQECRLVQANPASAPWGPSLCRTCPVPSITSANACPNMSLEAWVGRRWLLLKQMRVRGHCSLAGEEVADPVIGCGRCHEARWQAIRESLERADDG